MTLVYLGIGWLVGLVLAAACPLKWPIWLVLSSLPITAAILRRDDRGRWRLYLALAFVLLGAARYGAGRPRFGPADLASYNDAGWGEFEGYVAAEPDPRTDLTRLTVMVERMQLEGDEPRSVSGLVMVEAPRYPVFRYGDRLRFAGRLETPPEWDDFSYKDYLARQRIYSRVRQPIIEELDGRSGSAVKQTLLDLKSTVQTVLRQILPDPESSLLSGILLGNEGGISETLMDDFNATGTSHIIAISGFNINIIIFMLFTRLKQWAPRRPAGILAIVIIAAYTALVGGDAPVLRAAIMGSLLIVGKLLGRQSFQPTSLLAAAIGMTMVNPLLPWDVGFQLSFAAALGLTLYSERFRAAAHRGLLRRLGQEKADWLIKPLNDGLLLTLAAQITTLPLIVYHFGRLSLVSLLANCLILGVQPHLMALGGLATAAGLAFLPLGRVVAWLSYPLLWWSIRVAEALARFSRASVEAELALVGLLAIYTLLFGTTWLIFRRGGNANLWRKLTARRALVASCAAAAISLLTAISLISGLPDGRLHVTFLDVGEGEAILIQTPAGRRILVDGGPDPAILQSHLGRELSFWDRSLDLVIATHPDSAHVNGLPVVLESYRVGALITNGQSNGPPAWDELLALAKQIEIPVVTAIRGQTIDTGDGVVLDLLHPGSRLAERFNDNSIVLKLRYGDATILLTGDASQDVEADLIKAGLPLQSIVLKAADSGDRDGTGQPFLYAVNPWLVIFSVGDAKENPNHHPAERVLERVEKIAVGRTDQLGNIHLITDGQQLWAETER